MTKVGDSVDGCRVTCAFFRRIPLVPSLSCVELTTDVTKTVDEIKVKGISESAASTVYAEKPEFWLSDYVGSLPAASTVSQRSSQPAMVTFDLKTHMHT